MTTRQGTRLGVNLVADAPDGLEDLNRTICEFQRQVEVTRSLLRAERELKGKLSHNIKFNRVRPTLKFIYGQSPDDKIQQQRQESLSELDHSSRALCALTFTPHAILQLKDDAFEALIRGISVFVEKKGLEGLIESQIGHFIRRTLKELLEDTPTPLLWIESRPSKRRKVSPSRQNVVCESEGIDSEPRPRARSPRQQSRQQEAKGFPEAHMNTLAFHEDNVTADSSRSLLGMSEELFCEDALLPHSSISARVVNPGHPLQHCEVKPAHRGDRDLFPELSADYVDTLYGGLRASWFGRGVGLSDADVLQQFEEWTHTEGDTSMPENADELAWTDQLS